MFSSYVLYDTVAIEAVYFPRDFPSARDGAGGAAASPASSSSGADDGNTSYSLTLHDILLHRLTERYVGRVVPSRGLCVAVTEVMDYSASSVRGAAASAWLTATFGVCVFAPVPGTRLKARIAHQTAAGVLLTMDLFVAIPFLVPAEMLVAGSRFSPTHGYWYLPMEAEEQESGDPPTAVSASTAAAYNPYTVGAEVIVKVESCTVQSEEAVLAADEVEGVDGGGGGGGGAVPIMELRGSFLGDALGPMSWFAEDG
ncbi:DNA-directed RNA polymerase III subunit [Novymonas esmeraldas]|uniref:DNA-directed RNA polymerase III subunit n=1 Tax=Novymonas esmeraldas TaxID=1808958 RepID=A0AAW0EX80_9TRYP